MLDMLGTLKLWQKITLIVVTLAVAGGIYGIYKWTAGPTTTSVLDNVQVVQVQYGDIENSVSASGSLIFPNEESLTFGSAGTVQDVNVKEGDTVEEGQLLASLNDASVISLERAVVQAKVNLETAQEELEEALNPYTESDIAQAEADVVNARVTLETAQEELEEALNPYTESDIAQAELSVTNAEIALNKAQEELTDAEAQYLVNPSVPEWRLNYEQKMAQLTVAEYDLAEAEENLAEMLAGSDPLQVEQKQKQLALAQANLTKAEDELAEIQGGANSLEVELRQLEVAEAQAALDEAVALLGSATMVAPFDGTVTSVEVEVGEEVAASKVVIELVDSSVVEVSAILDEIDVDQVEVGQSASIYLDALPDLDLTGEVATISTSAQSQSGVVTYPVRIRIDVPSGVHLREGMSATANIVVEAAYDVLIIPTQTISGSGDNAVVSVMVGEEIQQKTVTLGMSDGSWTEVTGGLQETDMVVLTYSTSTTTTSTGSQSMPGGGMMPGGGTVFFR
jgi:HlyD family secretion protein